MQTLPPHMNHAILDPLYDSKWKVTVDKKWSGIMIYDSSSQSGCENFDCFTAFPCSKRHVLVYNPDVQNDPLIAMGPMGSIRRPGGKLHVHHWYWAFLASHYPIFDCLLSSLSQAGYRLYQKGTPEGFFQGMCMKDS